MAQQENKTTDEKQEVETLVVAQNMVQVCIVNHKDTYKKSWFLQNLSKISSEIFMSHWSHSDQVSQASENVQLGAITM